MTIHAQCPLMIALLASASWRMTPQLRVPTMTLPRKASLLYGPDARDETDEAHKDADNHAREEPDKEGHLRPPDHPSEDVAAVLVRAERVLPRRILKRREQARVPIWKRQKRGNDGHRHEEREDGDSNPPHPVMDDGTRDLPKPRHREDELLTPDLGYAEPSPEPVHDRTRRIRHTDPSRHLDPWIDFEQDQISHKIRDDHRDSS